jgi:hypothetical protein
MPVNDPKTPKPEDIVHDLVNGFLKSFSTPTTPAVDPVAEVNRLLKKAEESDYHDESQELLQIADRHIKIIELALAYQQ